MLPSFEIPEHCAGCSFAVNEGDRCLFDLEGEICPGPGEYLLVKREQIEALLWLGEGQEIKPGFSYDETAEYDANDMEEAYTEGAMENYNEFKNQIALLLGEKGGGE